MLEQDDVRTEEQPEASKPSRLVLWLLIASLIGGFFPIMLINSVLKEEIVTLTEVAAQGEATLSAPLPVNPEREALSTHLTEIRGTLNSLNGIQDDLSTNQLNIPSVISGLGEYEAGKLTLTAIEQDALHFTVEGMAVDEASIMGYINHLRQDDRFEDVTMQSIIRDITEYDEPYNSFTLLIQLALESEPDE